MCATGKVGLLCRFTPRFPHTHAHTYVRMSPPHPSHALPQVTLQPNALRPRSTAQENVVSPFSLFIHFFPQQRRIFYLFGRFLQIKSFAP